MGFIATTPGRLRAALSRSALGTSLLGLSKLSGEKTGGLRFPGEPHSVSEGSLETPGREALAGRDGVWGPLFGAGRGAEYVDHQVHRPGQRPAGQEIEKAEEEPVHLPGAGGDKGSEQSS